MFGLSDWGYILVGVVGALASVLAAYFGVISNKYQISFQKKTRSGQIETSEARDIFDAIRSWQDSRDRFEEMMMRSLELYSNLLNSKLERELAFQPPVGDLYEREPKDPSHIYAGGAMADERSNPPHDDSSSPRGTEQSGENGSPSM